MESFIRHCLSCGKPIKAGRSDKKFCDSLCKDAFHNTIKTGKHKVFLRVDRILKRNRDILQQLFNSGKERLFDMETLLKAGFEFDYHTHFVITKTKCHQFVFCYDYGYRETEKGKYQLIKSFK